MGTSLIRVSVIANRSTRSSEIDRNNNSSEESQEQSNEDHLLKTPAYIKRDTSFARELITKAAKIGKFTKFSERRIRDERPVVPPSTTKQKIKQPRMNEDEKLNKIEEEEELSLSEDITLSTRQHTSSESSKIGEKKKRKFKPAKFISKHLKIKKEEKSDSEKNSETRSETDSSKSPNLGALKKNIAKKFSRKKKTQVSPIESGDSSQQDEPLNNERDSEKLAKSDFNVIRARYEVGKVDEIASESLSSPPKTDPLLPNPELPIAREGKSTSSENKKVQLQITISGKKVEKIQTTAKEGEPIVVKSTSATTDKASSPLQYYKGQNDIILPSVSSAVQVNKVREEFFSVMVSSGNKNTDNANEQHMQNHTKSISNDALQQSVSRSLQKQTNSKGSVDENVKLRSELEIEKYSLNTSSLNSIISTAKDIECLDVEDIEFPENIPELKIIEEVDKVNVEKLSERKLSLESIESTVSVKEVVKEFENLKKKNSEKDDEMKRTKIPVNKRKVSSEINQTDKDINPTTVHTQEAHKPYHLSFSSSVDELNKNSSETQSEEIIFEVGTAVRPPKILSANRNNVAPIIITDIESGPAHESVDDVFHSPKSEPSFSIEKRESRTRRKIAYIPQLTIYTPEEQELLRSNIIANSESFDTPSLPPDSSIFPIFDESLMSNMTPTTPEKREYLYKILVIGELGTGKTSFIKRYVHQFFSQNYRATIGVDFALKVLNWDQSTIIRLQLWDIAGQERFGNMTRVYYKEAVGAFIVFDVTRQATFDAVNKWKTDLDSKVQLPDGSPIPCILLANKCDQPKQGLVTMPAKMDEYCKQNGFAGWFETSAKENTNIEESAKALVSKILLNDKLIHNDMLDGDRLILNAEDIGKPKKFCSC